MKKVIALIFVILILFVGCSESGEQSIESGEYTNSTETVQSAEKTEQELYPLPQKNMEGFELRFYNFDDTYLTWSINILDSGEENGDNVNDAVYRRNRRVEEMYNCVINEHAVRNPLDNLRNLVLAGEDLYDVVMLYDENVANTYCQGLLNTWDCLTYVDLERSWWDQSANEVFSIHGNQFAAVGNFSLSMLTRGFIILFNKEMVENVNLGYTLYDLVRENQWTIDKYIEIAKLFVSDINGDGVFNDQDQYPFGGAIKLHYGSLVTGAGVKYITEDSEGTPTFAIPGNEYAINVFEKIFNLHSGTNIFFKIKENVHDGSIEAREMFKSYKLAFGGTATKSIELFRDVDFDIGILPYPKYDSNQENYYILTSGGAVATIPIILSEERMDNVGIILDALARDSQENLVPTYREVVLKTKYTRDEDSAEMLDIIFNSAVYDLGLSVWPSATYYVYMECYLKMNNNFASLTDSIELSVKNTIETMLNAIESNSVK